MIKSILKIGVVFALATVSFASVLAAEGAAALAGMLCASGDDQRCVRATAQTSTRAAPASRNTRASSPTVLPVVTTSSMIAT